MAQWKLFGWYANGFPEGFLKAQGTSEEISSCIPGNSDLIGCVHEASAHMELQSQDCVHAGI